MKILLIGNFAPPYEEENLHNLSLLKRLEEDGHQCTVINTSENPSIDPRFIDTGGMPDFLLTLFRHCLGKDVVHFLTKGYLRLGLLKLMFSIVFGKLFRARTFITIHSELFSIQGQMRSPVGGRQTLFTAFTVADKIICADKDTYNVAAMYMKKSNFELIPSFVYLPKEISEHTNSELEKLKPFEKAIIFSNIKYPSFVFDILKELLANHPLPSDTGIVMSVSEKPPLKLQHVLQDTGKTIKNSLIFIDSDDLNSTLNAYSKADIIARPPSCDGTTFFESFALSVKKTLKVNENVYFPKGLLFVKEGETAEMCLCILNSLLCVESGRAPKEKPEDSYARHLALYQK